MNINIENKKVVIVVDSQMYSIEVVFKCFYWYTGSYEVTITPVADQCIQISLEGRGDIEWDTEALISKIRRDLVDFKLRDIVFKETSTIRELITAKAFAYSDLIENPVSDVSDPVGFDPLMIQQ